jgi:hypothetical protein
MSTVLIGFAIGAGCERTTTALLELMRQSRPDPTELLVRVVSVVACWGGALFYVFTP